MEMAPRSLVIGAFVPPTLPGAFGLDAEKINAIWADLAPLRQFTQLQTAPDGRGANFLGTSLDEGLTIQLPLLQVRQSVRDDDVAVAAEATNAILRVVVGHIAAPQLFNLGVRLVYSGVPPADGGRSFVLERLLSGGESVLQDLGGAVDSSWGGAKYVVAQDGRQFTIVIEPSVPEQMRRLYIDVDTSFSPSGPFDLDVIPQRVAEVREFVEGPLHAFLESLAS